MRWFEMVVGIRSEDLVGFFPETPLSWKCLSFVEAVGFREVEGLELRDWSPLLSR